MGCNFMYRSLSRILTVLLAVCLLCSVMSVGVFAEDIEITRVMATSDTEAVVMRTAGEIAFRTSSPGASITSVVWTDSSGKSLGPSDAFADDTYTLTVTLTANEGYYFSQSAVGVLYNNVSLRRQIKPPIWSPIIYKHPLSDPAVEPGSLVSYVSTAGFATSSVWMFVSPEGDGPMPPNELRDKFPQITIDDAGIGRIIIYNVPAELNGWEIFCRFYESTSAASMRARASIRPTATAPRSTSSCRRPRRPRPRRSPRLRPRSRRNQRRNPRPSRRRSLRLRRLRSPRPFPSCGSITNPATGRRMKAARSLPRASTASSGSRWTQGEHSFVWKQVENSNEEIGTCSVCGYTESRVVADEAQQSVKGKILIGLGVATAVLMMLSLAAPARKKKKK